MKPLAVISAIVVVLGLHAQQPEPIPAPREAEPSIDGFYAVSGETPGGGVYLGTCLVRQRGETYLFSWVFESGVTNSGCALRDGNVIVVGFTTPDGGAGVHRYEIQGKKLVGRWGGGAGKCGKETLVFLKGLSL